MNTYLTNTRIPQHMKLKELLFGVAQPVDDVKILDIGGIWGFTKDEHPTPHVVRGTSNPWKFEWICAGEFDTVPKESLLFYDSAAIPVVETLKIRHVHRALYESIEAQMDLGVERYDIAIRRALFKDEPLTIKPENLTTKFNLTDALKFPWPIDADTYDEVHCHMFADGDRVVGQQMNSERFLFSRHPYWQGIGSPTPEAFVGEVQRVLKRNGRFFFTGQDNVTYEENGIETLKSTLRTSGFDIHLHGRKPYINNHAEPDEEWHEEIGTLTYGAKFNHISFCVAEVKK